MSNPFIGEIRRFAGNFAPRGWAFCDGQLLPISQNTALFSILGTTYGGDGRTTVGLPDLRGHAALHPGRGPGLSSYRLGQRSGAEKVTIQANQMPSHNHSVGCTSTEGNVGSPVGAIPGAETAATVSFWSDAAADGTMKASMIKNAGGSQGHTNMQPYLAVNHIIALVGVFPSRS